MNSLHALNLIGGEWMPAHSGGWGTRHSPADGSALGRFAASGRSDADAAIDAARRAFNQPGRARCAWHVRCATAPCGSTTTTSSSRKRKPAATGAVAWAA